MFKYFFGDDDTTSLKNEPTIDYNHTIHSFTNVRSAERIPNLDRKSNDYAASFQPPSRHDYPIIDYSDDDLDSIDFEMEDDLKRDYQVIRDNYTKTSDKLKYDWVNHYKNIYNNNDHIDQKLSYNENTNYSLPNDYPGKFVQGNRNREARNEKSSLFRDNTNDTYVKSDTQLDIDKQIQQLQHEIDQEFKQKSNKASNQSSQDIQLNSIIIKIKNQNQFLEELNEIVQLNDDKGEIPNNLLDELNKLKLDYIKELKNNQIFYQSYYKLLNKYRSLKKDSNSKDHNNQTSKSKSTFTLKEKVKLIRSLTKENTIKLTCSNILNELDKLEDKDKIIEELNKKLEAANLKIQQLESIHK